ncbi:hypothetical protein BDZ45DRAFT_749480 [Acephala macrosclerotiorum]|nr:hypothetical protein BDZ45DRAFT_749480 [Acephala macrosclerotiorum]
MPGTSLQNTSELACMRTVPARSLKRAMSYNNLPSFTDTVLTGGTPPGRRFTQLPLLVTNAMNEVDGVLPFSALTGGLPIWRYVFNGTFSETVPYPWMRPYHGSDLELILGSYKAVAYQELGLEIKTAAKYLHDAVASFVRNPVKGLESFGWPRYNVNGIFRVLSLVYRDFAGSYDSSHAREALANESAAVTFEDPAQYDTLCQYL